MRKAHNKLTQEQVINSFKEVHGDAFDYSKVVYIDNKTPVEVYCKKHDFTFTPSPKNYKNGRKYKDYKYKPDFWFAGHTECYTKNLPSSEIFNF